MNLARLEMRQTQAAIQMTSNRPVLEMRQGRADVSMTQGKVEMTQQTRQGTLEVDSSVARSESNLKSALELGRYFGQLGEQGVREATSQAAREGDQLMRIENGNPIPSIAASKVNDPYPIVDMGYMPKSIDRVKLTYTPADVKIEWNLTPAQIDVSLTPAEISFTPWTTDISLRQEASLEMWPVGGMYDETR
ncbi:hypothetical protein EVJ27_13540 [Exiguobacterium sp. SH3S2]|uniref:DUF6470 family protein n=2 Tax=Exiguobacterium TaxID=33986 RepID=UPI001040893C|nr:MULTISPECIES: DUF6470 family protein [unclassified Exiguobacterium]TCI41588.1 hypothetical protein EVJ28_13480 [Exiguobacterium sp. SH3S3]TCI51410.1 hypothetical protein EVJ30_11125 [Exiguobacterium sp. SH5S13]TCI58204.1 hypothetical protein EVJ27_13540 [Exiguobacterium sp. SH3S2]